MVPVGAATLHHDIGSTSHSDTAHGTPLPLIYTSCTESRNKIVNTLYTLKLQSVWLKIFVITNYIEHHPYVISAYSIYNNNNYFITDNFILFY